MAKTACIYAGSGYFLGKEPWCRGLDPLYWALKGHPDENGWNPISALIAYRRDAMRVVSPDIAAFLNGEPSTEAVAAVITFDLKHKEWVEEYQRQACESTKRRLLEAQARLGWTT